MFVSLGATAVTRALALPRQPAGENEALRNSSQHSEKPAAHTNESRDSIQSTATLLLGLFNAAEEGRSVPSAPATNASSDRARL